MTCASPLTWDSLLAYWLDEHATDTAAQIEEHYLGCALCSRRLEQLVTLAQAVRALTRMSGVSVIINDEFVRRLVEDGLRVQEYRVPRNGSVNCTVTPEDDFVVARLEAPLDGVQRLDMIYLDNDGNAKIRQEDIPFIAKSGGVLFTTRMDTLRALPAITLHVRLLVVENSVEHTLGDYTFNHTPN